jgi:signal transduction histidine kinase
MASMSEREPGSSGNAVRRFLSGVRIRLFVYALLMLLLGIATTVVTVRLVLIDRVNSGIERALERETREFRNLAKGVFLPTGEPFDDLPLLFDTFSRRNEVDAPASLLAFVDGEPYYPDPAGPGSLTADQLDPDLVDTLRTTSQVRTGTTDSDLGEVMYRAIPVRIDGELRGSLVVTYLAGFDHDQVDETVRIAALIGLVSFLVGGLIAYLAAGRVLRPLRELTETARSIEESDLTRRIRVTGHDELAELSVTFNAMLDRLERAFAGQKDLLRSVNHELSTPITIIKGHLELLAEDQVERDSTIELVTGELDRMWILVNDLLTLAEADRDDFVRAQPVDLSQFMREVLDKARMLGDRDWRLDLAFDRVEPTGHEDASGVPAHQASLDPQRVTQAMLNLVDNAVKQTTAGQAITIGVSERHGEVRFWVDDEGPGVDPEDRDRLFDRFVRGDNGPRYPGSGLGLAIVKAIAEAHGGRAETASGDLAGARFTIILPTRPADGFAGNDFPPEGSA